MGINRLNLLKIEFSKFSQKSAEKRIKTGKKGKKCPCLLYFATSTKKAVWQELQENSNVEILAYADNVSVRCSGMVNFCVSEDMKRWIYDHNDVLSSLYNSYDQLEYICLPIAELDYFDLSPTPPINQHFDLMAGEMANGFVGERFSK